MAVEVATLTAQNTFTALINANAGARISVSISGVSDSTVTVQRRLDGTNWRDVEDYTVSVEKTYVCDSACDIRAGIKTSNYGSDTVVIRLGLE